MNFQLRFERKAEKNLEKINSSDRIRILSALEKIRSNPFIGKKLKGDLDGMFSARVWPYRIIYSIFKEQLVVVVINIDHRQSVYKK